ncbi:MAG: DUF6503 family protein [Fulvivirga sp.]|nr:DUF6503 family protein [Fulvivirga sp.]
MKYLSYTLFISLSCLYSCNLYDLRQNVPAGINNKKQADPHEIINKCVSAHGWDHINNAYFTVTYTDQWPNFWFRTFFHPWPDKDKLLKQEFSSKSLYSAELTFVEGIRAGEIWGLEDNQPYLVIDDEKKYRRHSNTQFYLPTYQYFFQMPYWLQQVPILKYLGETTLGEQNYHLVYGTWQQETPHEAYDQYLYWINTETYFLEIVQYTIRDQMPNAHGTNTFSDFRKVKELIIPFIQTITFEPEDEEIMHQIKIDKIDYQQLE